MTEFQGVVALDNCLVQILLFADDTVVMAQTERDLSVNIKGLYEAIKRHGLTLNWSKFNTMVFSKEHTECKVEMEGVMIEQARETVYLGVGLSENGRVESELEQRNGMAATTVGALREPVFGNKELSKEAKLRVYNAVVVPTLVYGCEAMEMKVLRRVAGVTRLDCIRNEEIRKELKQEAMVAQVKRRREGFKDSVGEPGEGRRPRE